MDTIHIKIWGLSGVGKTALLAKLDALQFQGVSFSELDLDPQPSDTPPSLGVEVAIIRTNDVKFSQWDLARQLQFRKSLWKIYTHPKDFGMIYVVDMSNSTQFQTVRNHLCQLLDLSPFQKIPLAIFANKVDLLAKQGELVSEDNLLEVLDCIKNRDIKSRIFLSSVLTGEGILEGINWLIETTQEIRSSLSEP
jgi:GTPase SAR1 family protein